MFLNCVDKHSEMPQKSYFRMVMDPELKFDGDGNLSPGPMARFSNRWAAFLRDPYAMLAVVRG